MKVSTNLKTTHKGMSILKGSVSYEEMKENLRKGAKDVINLIKRKHASGFNINDQPMNSLGKNMNGYTDSYAKWKQRYLARMSGVGTSKGFMYNPFTLVNLDLTGRFHNGLNLRFRGLSSKGQMSYSIVTVRPIKNRYKNSRADSKSYWKIVSQFEKFVLSPNNRNVLLNTLSNGTGSLANFIYKVK